MYGVTNQLSLDHSCATKGTQDLLQRVSIARNADHCTSYRDSVSLSFLQHSGVLSRRMKTIVRFSASGRTIILVSEEVKFIRIFAGDHP